MLILITTVCAIVCTVISYNKWNKSHIMITTGGVSGRLDAHFKNIIFFFVIYWFIFRIIFAFLGEAAIWVVEHWYIPVGILCVSAFIYSGINTISEKDAIKLRDSLREHKEQFKEIESNVFLDCKSLSTITNNQTLYSFDVMAHLYDTKHKEKLKDMELWLIRFTFDCKQKIIFKQVLTTKKIVSKKFNPFDCEMLTVGNEPEEKEMTEIATGSLLYNQLVSVYQAQTGKRWKNK